MFSLYRQLLLGLACNENTAELELDVSGNGLGAQGAHVLESCLHGIKCLASLDISDNGENETLIKWLHIDSWTSYKMFTKKYCMISGLEGDLGGVVTAAGKNKSLKHLNLGRNLQSTKAKHVAQVMEAIVAMLQVSLHCLPQVQSLPVDF
jgi:hypothetical protein